MKIRIPQTSEFSHPDLVNCFSKNLLKNLVLLKDAQDRFSDELDSVYKMFEDIIPGKREDVLFDFLPKKQDSVLDMQKTKKLGFKIMQDCYGGMKAKCELCGERGAHQHHILQKSYFRNRERLGQSFKFFQNHYSNLMHLCPNHHDKIHGRQGLKLTKKELRKLVNKRKKLNAALLKRMKKEIIVYKKGYKILKYFKDANEKRVSNEFGSAVKKLKILARKLYF